MKKFLVCLAMGMVMAGLAGCKSCDWLWRGSSSSQQHQAPMYCEPVCNPCEAAPCGSCVTGGAPAVMVPGPETYVAPAGR